MKKKGVKRKRNDDSNPNDKNEDVQGKFWCWRISYPIRDPDFEGKDEYTIYQHELGEETNINHLQGYTCFYNNQRSSYLIKILRQYSGQSTWFQLRKGKHSEAKGYCSKKDSRLDGPYEYGDDSEIAEGKGQRSDLISIRDKIDKGEKEVKIWSEHFGSYTRYHKGFREYRMLRQQDEEQKKFIDENKDIDPYGWQLEAMDRINDQNKRTLLWIYDLKGKTGKTHFAKYLMSKYNVYYIRGGKHNDIAYAYNYEQYIIFDYPRDKEDFVIYSTIEMFKDGLVQSNKFNSHVKLTSSKKVLVLSNWPPEKSKLSIDRWEICEIINGQLIDK